MFMTNTCHTTPVTHSSCIFSETTRESKAEPRHHMGLFDKVKAKVSSSSSSTAGTTLRPDRNFPHVDTLPLDDSALPRYRKQRGINLGAWFVSERWIYDKPYQQAASPGQADFDIASGKDAKRLYEEHWDSYMTEDDWQWLADRGFNSVRLPVESPS